MRWVFIGWPFLFLAVAAFAFLANLNLLCLAGAYGGFAILIVGSGVVASRRKAISFKWDLIRGAIVLVVTFWLLSIWFSPLVVQGKSMEPTLQSGQLVVFKKNVTTLYRGDVVLIQAGNPFSFLIVKRILGLPGEYYMRPGIERAKLGASEYFVAGDNWTESFDSRDFGPVYRRMICGRMISLNELK